MQSLSRVDNYTYSLILARDNWINGEKDYLKNRDNWQGALNLQRGQSGVQRGAKKLDFRARGREFRSNFRHLKKWQWDQFWPRLSLEISLIYLFS